MEELDFSELDKNLEWYQKNKGYNTDWNAHMRTMELYFLKEISLSLKEIVNCLADPSLIDKIAERNGNG